MKSLIGNRYFLLTGILLATFVVTLQACTRGSQPESTGKEKAADQATPRSVNELLSSLNMYQFQDPEMAPEFELTSLDGTKVSLSQYRGNVVLLSFWATW